MFSMTFIFNPKIDLLVSEPQCVKLIFSCACLFTSRATYLLTMACVCACRACVLACGQEAEVA